MINHNNKSITTTTKPKQSNLTLAGQHKPSKSGLYLLDTKIYNNLNTSTGAPSPSYISTDTFLFVSIFGLGFIGVLLFYVYKKTYSRDDMPYQYQYSVLNSNNQLDPLLVNDLGRNEDDDNFLDISRYRYSDDDDVELLGVSCKNCGNNLIFPDRFRLNQPITTN